MYEAFALRQARLEGRRSSDWFFRYSDYGVPDGPRPMDLFFWVLRDGDRTVLVDTGFAAAHGRSRGITESTPAAELLNRIDVDPRDVQHVILTHMHFDHVGNVGLFPNATFTIDRKELDFWTGPHGSQPAISAPVEVDELCAVLDLHREGRLEFADESRLPSLGIEITPVGGHTPGQLIVAADTGSGRVVLASDAVHYYEELRENRLYNGFTNVEDMLDAYALLRELMRRPGHVVVAGHDPEVTSSFRSVAEDCLDLTDRLR